MTVMTKEQIEALAQRFPYPRAHRSGEPLLEIVYADPGNHGFYYREEKPDSMTCYVRIDTFAQTALALHQQLADAEAAQALVVERAAEHIVSEGERLAEGIPKAGPGLEFLRELADEVRALADTDGLALVQALRAERDAATAKRNDSERVLAGMTLELDRLAAANAALEAQVARLVGAVKEYHLALDRRQNGNTAGYRLQDEIQRILDMPWRQGAALAEVQADARREGGE